MEKLTKVLSGNEQNHLFPFFWQHGEDDDKITEYLEKIYNTGIKSVCIESRPHPDFLCDGWWKTLDHIIREAKRLGMTLWILDDKKFPTGYANGQVPEELRKVYLSYHRFDVVGPKRYAEINLNYLPGFKAMLKEDHSKDVIIKAIRVKNNPEIENGFFEDTMLDVSECIDYNKKILYVDIPKGLYSYYVFYYSRYGGEDATFEYLNPMDSNATKILVNEVYEKHYERYKEEFGKTIVGFFSDEPRFGNTNRSSSIGREEMSLPWMPNMLNVMKKEIPDFDVKNLVFLFHGKSKLANKMRFDYMNLISKLYSQNFSQVIGKWCLEHGVDYTGHIIEDNNADSRLGKGAGHFFRAMKGQSIAGIDVIGGQLVPGQPFHHDAFLTGGSQGEFFHYALCKLGASLAKLDSNKDGTLMCEAFGAYGWVEGLKLMKWITDHLLSHGVNLIVPHAFSPKKFPDWDCPPHFYANGNNPEFRYFSKWSNYTNRMCELLSGGYQVCQVGVLYHSFAEWSGDYMPVQKVIKELLQNQIDCNVISEDFLMNSEISQGKYQINGYEYTTLVVPYVQQLSPKMLVTLAKLEENGVEIIYLDAYPESLDGTNIELNGKIVDIVNLVKYLSTKICCEVKVTEFEKDLTYYHYRHDDGDVFLFFNESINELLDTKVTLKYNDELLIYDAYENQTYCFDSVKSDGALKFDLRLKPYEMLVLVSGKGTQKVPRIKEKITDLTEFDVYLKSYEKDNFEFVKHISDIEYLGKDFNDFSGTICYKTSFQTKDNNLMLDIKEVYEVVEVIVNGINCGVKITPDYIFDISKASKLGENTLEIYVTNTLNRNQRDMMSMYIEGDPLGIVGNVELYKSNQK